MTEKNETEEREEEMRGPQTEEKERDSQASRGEPEMRGPQPALAERQRSLEWRCLTCSTTAPPTPGAYMGFIQHSCTGKRQIWLVDKATGEQLANNAKQAIQMGLIEKKRGDVEVPLEGKPVEPPEGKMQARGEKESEIAAPQTSSDGIFRYTITLPADAFTLFNLAKTCGLEKDNEKPFDEWLWDCIVARFAKDYKKRLVLAPIGEE